MNNAERFICCQSTGGLGDPKGQYSPSDDGVQLSAESNSFLKTQRQAFVSGKSGQVFSPLLSEQRWMCKTWQLGYDQLFKASPIFALIIPMNSVINGPRNELSLDEKTIAFKGRITLKMDNPKEPEKYGNTAFSTLTKSRLMIFLSCSMASSLNYSQFTAFKTLQNLKLLEKNKSGAWRATRRKHVCAGELFCDVNCCTSVGCSKRVSTWQSQSSSVQWSLKAPVIWD